MTAKCLQKACEMPSKCLQNDCKNALKIPEKINPILSLHIFCNTLVINFEFIEKLKLVVLNLA